MNLRRYLIAAALSALTTLPVAAQQTTPSTPSNRPSATAPSTQPQQQGNLIDINSASAEELDKLPGIGSARAQAIIANRPYRGKDDLAQRKIVPQNVYDQIKDKIVARQAPAGGRQGSTTPGSSSGSTSSPGSTGTGTKPK